MTPALFVNCSKHPFIDLMMTHRKPFETRTRNTLKSLLDSFLGEQILLAETGNGAPLAKATARIDYYIAVYTREEWEKYRDQVQIPAGSKYDWKPETKVKWLYHLTDVRPIEPFRLPQSCRRHGRVWAEYEY